MNPFPIGYNGFFCDFFNYQVNFLTCSKKARNHGLSGEARNQIRTGDPRLGKAMRVTLKNLL